MHHACEAAGSVLTRVKTEDEKSKRDSDCLALGKSRPCAAEKILFQKPLSSAASLVTQGRHSQDAWQDYPQIVVRNKVILWM